MTQQDVVQHWRDGSKRALSSAEVLYAHGDYPMAMFLGHLAVEKALKCAYVHEHDHEPPYTHNLPLLASQLSLSWSDSELEELFKLTKFSRYGRYDDSTWMNTTATMDSVKQWLPRVTHFLSRLHP